MIKHSKNSSGYIENMEDIKFASDDDIELQKRFLEVPHECDDPECPGNKTRWKLENRDRFRDNTKRLIDAIKNNTKDDDIEIPLWLVLPILEFKQLLLDAEELEGE